MDHRDFGVLHAIRQLNKSDIFSFVTFGALLVGLGAGTALLSASKAAGRARIAGDFLVVLGPLLGVVVAAFALVVGMGSDDYLRFLVKQPTGVFGFLRPFLVGISVQVLTLLWAVGYRASAVHLPSKLEIAGWLVLACLFVFSLLDVIGLAKNVLAHAATRADELRVREMEEAAKRH